MEADMENEYFSNLTNIQKFFYGQSVFLTGVTGLIGKTVLEKLLRCCPGLGMVYVLIRPKKGLTPQQRIENIFELDLFRLLKEKCPDFREKVHVVEGDVSKPNLNLSVEDYEQVRQNVSVVINCAAYVQFKGSLKVAVENNVISTKSILELCHAMPHIKAFVHISTAYVKREVDGTALEEIPKSKISPSKLLDALEWMDEDSQAAVEKYLLDNDMGQVISYTISKALAEEYLNDEKGSLPIAIVRPSYTVSTWKDPFPGWIDQIQGLSGLIYAVGKGVLRTLRNIPELKATIIPLDVTVNTIVASAWHVGTTRPMHPYIINCTMDLNSIPRKKENMLGFIEKDLFYKYPVVNIFRYPDIRSYDSSLAYHAHAIIDQWIPALIIDFFLLIFMKKTIFVRLYYNINYVHAIFKKGFKIPWEHRRENYIALQNNLSDGDKNIFFMDMDDLDWRKYMEDCFIGGRLYLAHEQPSTLEYARKKAKIWYAVTTFLKWLFILYLLYFLCYDTILFPLYKVAQENIVNILM